MTGALGDSMILWMLKPECRRFTDQLIQGKATDSGLLTLDCSFMKQDVILNKVSDERL